MRKFCKSRGIIPSQERETRWETIKVFFMTIRNKSGVLRDLLLKKKTKKQQQQQR